LSDLKARDILGELDTRSPCGTALTNRVGQRGWSRPRVSVSPRLFLQYRLGDPWDPTSQDAQAPIGLGPVNLRLGEKKRQPAPHLKPKAPPKPQKAAPAAPQHSPSTSEVGHAPAPSADPATSAEPAAASDEEETARLAEVAAQKRREAEAARSWPRRRRVESTTGSDAARDGAGLRAPLAIRPEARDEQTDEVAQATAPQSGDRKDTGGRFRMKPAAASRAPVVREIQSESSPATADEPPPPRAAPAAAVGGGLDDLFAAAAQQGRQRVPRRPPAAAEE